MKNISLIVFLLCSPFLLLGQSNCSLCIPSTFKILKPFECLSSRQGSIITVGNEKLIVKNLVLSNETWQYKGELVKTLTKPWMAEPAHVTGYVITINNGCKVVCKTIVDMNYNLGRTPLFTFQLNSDCSPAFVKIKDSGNIQELIIDAIKIN